MGAPILGRYRLDVRSCLHHYMVALHTLVLVMGAHKTHRACSVSAPPRKAITRNVARSISGTSKRINPPQFNAADSASSG